MGVPSLLPESDRLVKNPREIINQLTSFGKIYKDSGQDFTRQEIQEIEGLQKTYIEHYLTFPPGTPNGIEADLELAQSVLQSLLYGGIYRDHRPDEARDMVKIMNALIMQSGATRASAEIVVKNQHVLSIKPK